MRRNKSALEEGGGGGTHPQKCWAHILMSKKYGDVLLAARSFLSAPHGTPRASFSTLCSRAVCECVCFALCAQENQTHRYLRETYLKRDTKAEIPLCACEYAGGAYCAAAHSQDSQVSAFKGAQE